MHLETIPKLGSISNPFLIFFQDIEIINASHASLYIKVKIKIIRQHNQVRMELKSNKIGLLKRINRIQSNLKISQELREVGQLQLLIEMVEYRANLKTVLKILKG